MRRRSEFCLAGAIAGTLLAACASSPPRARPDVAFSDIVDGRVPAFSLFDITAGEQNQLHLLVQSEGSRTRGTRHEAWFRTGPIARVVYTHAPEPIRQPTTERSILGAIAWPESSWRASDAEARWAAGAPFGVQRKPRLAEAPTTEQDTAPIDHVVTKLPQPGRFVIWRGGRVRHLVEVHNNAFWATQPGFLSWGQYLRDAELSAPRGAAALRAALAPLLSNPQLAASKSALERLQPLLTKAEAQQLEELSDARSEWQKAFVAATPRAAYDLLADLDSVLAPAVTHNGKLTAAARTLRNDTYERWLERARSAWPQPECTRVREAAVKIAGQCLDRVRRSGTVGPATRRELAKAGPALDQLEAFAAIEVPDPFERCRRRAAVLGARGESNATDEARQIPSEAICQDLASILRTLSTTRESGPNAFNLAWAKAAYSGFRRNNRQLGLDCLTARADVLAFHLRPFRAARDELEQIAAIHQQLEDIQEQGAGALQEAGMRTAQLVATKLDAQVERMRFGPDQAILDALGEQIVADRSLAAANAMAVLHPLLEQLPTKGVAASRRGAFEDFKRQPLVHPEPAGRAAGSMSYPLGVELANRAKELTANGEIGRAALYYYAAGRLGEATHLDPIDDFAVRWTNAKSVDADTPSAWRQRWLRLARQHALDAVQAVLPKLADTESSLVLLNRHASTQFAGMTRLGRLLGVRLSSVGTTRTEEGVQLCRIGNDYRFAKPGAGIRPANWRELDVDLDAFDRMGDARALLEQLRSDLDAARAALELDRPELEARAEAVESSIQTVRARMDQGAIDPRSATRELDMLGRRNRSLRLALSQYASRAEHAEQTTAEFRRAELEHNDLLAKVQEQLTKCHREVLWPAIGAGVQSACARLQLSAAERAAREFWIGLRSTPQDPVARRSFAPRTAEQLVRDTNDPAAAALALRLAVHELTISSGRSELVAKTHAAEQFRPAFLAFVRTYGTDAFADLVWTAVLRKDAMGLETVIEPLEIEAKRELREKCGVPPEGARRR